MPPGGAGSAGSLASSVGGAVGRSVKGGAAVSSAPGLLTAPPPASGALLVVGDEQVGEQVLHRRGRGPGRAGVPSQPAERSRSFDAADRRLRDSGRFGEVLLEVALAASRAARRRVVVSMDLRLSTNVFGMQVRLYAGVRAVMYSSRIHDPGHGDPQRPPPRPTQGARLDPSAARRRRRHRAGHLFGLPAWARVRARGPCEALWSGGS